MRQEPSYTPLLFLGGVLLLSGGAVVVIASRRQDSGPALPPVSEVSRPVFAGAPANQLASAPAAGAPEGSADPAAAEPIVLQYTKASISLQGQLDKYNKWRKNVPLPVHKDSFLPDDPAGKLYNGIRNIVGSIPVVGPVVSTIYDVVIFLASRLVGGSHGGFDDVGIFVKVRADLYFVIPWENTLLLARPFKSQIIEPSAPTLRPEWSQTWQRPSDYDDQYKAWLRRYLQENAFKAEWFRMQRTNDEVTLPVVAINILYDSGFWPPPIEPMPLTREEFVRRYEGTKNPIVGYEYFEGGYNLSKIIRPTEPPARQEYDRKLAQDVFAKLWAEYEEDAKVFRDKVAKVVMPMELVQLARDNGMIPRYGSLANLGLPPGTGPLGSPTNPIGAPADRGERL